MPGLDRTQLKRFLDKGFVVIEDCFSRAAARKVVARAYERMGLDPEKPEGWTQDSIILPDEAAFPVKDFAPRAWEAICALIGGAGRIAQGEGLCWTDHVMVRFPVRNAGPWRPPSAPEIGGWHIDAHDRRRYLDSLEAGLVCYVLFDDVAPRGGGTYLACDSVGLVARELAAHPEGIAPEEFDPQAIFRACRDFVEVTGKAGSVALVHPFMLHRESKNHAKRPRFMSARVIELKEPMRFDRPRSSDSSPVETAILRPLGLTVLSFRRR